MKKITKVLILLLMLNALVVFIILSTGNTCWELIVLYWFILTVKNFIDWLGTRKKKEE